MYRIKVKGRSQTALLVKFDNSGTGAGTSLGCGRLSKPLAPKGLPRASCTAVNGTSPNYFST